MYVSYNVRRICLAASATAMVAACANKDVDVAGQHGSLQTLASSLAGPGYGCAYSIHKNGDLIEEHASGRRSLNSQEALSAADLFDIGSVSKNFTAAVIYRLAQKDALSLEDPISEYVEDLPAWGAEVTIADLVYMRSGVPEFLVDDENGKGWSGDTLYGLGIRLDQSASAARILDAVRQMKELEFRPGSQYEYSNSNYMLLRVAAEKASERGFGDLLQETAQAFAGVEVMVSTFDEGRRTSPSQVEGHDLSEEGPAAFIADWDVLGASSVWISVHDLSRWGQALMNDEARFEFFSQPGVIQAPERDADRGYAAGMMTMTLNGEPVIYHLGGTEGFSSGLFLRPENKASLAFSCNMSPDLLVAHGMETAAKDMLITYGDLIFLHAWLSN